MELELKKKILNLYQEYDTVYGPYGRNDGRQHIILRKDKYKGSPQRTVSYPKALLEVKLNRKLKDNETTDHEDEDFRNNDIDNLNPLTKIENIQKSFNNNPERYEKIANYICPECNTLFMKVVSRVTGNQEKQGKAGPFCSKNCAGKYGTNIQYGR